MNDPYQVLNIPSTATDEQVKKAYRELARKYHPDNYHDNPLADLAQEKMKEINEAYDTIMRMRSGRGGGTYQAPNSQSGAYRSQQGSAGDVNPLLRQARAAIARGAVAYAEQLLNGVQRRDGEWYFLKGSLCYRRGWMDEALRYYQTACQMEPGNPEYRQALEMMQGGGYRPAGYDVYSTSCAEGNFCLRLACLGALCNGGWFFYPCYC